MASQRDIFLDSQDNCKDKKKKVPSTWDPSWKMKEYMYEWIVLFNWEQDVRNPFESYKLSIFNSKDFKPEWISKNLGIASRTTKLTNLSPFPGGTYSLFSKLELG